MYEEKRRLETKITELEEELEDEQNNSEQMLEKFKKLQFDLEKMATDLHIEKSNVTKNEVNNHTKLLTSTYLFLNFNTYHVIVLEC